MEEYIISLEKAEYGVLFPAPSVRDFENVEYSDKSLTDGPLKVVMNYRGNLLCLENGAQVYRSNPLTDGVNGYTYDPVEDEDVYISYFSNTYKARVGFSRA